MSRTNRAKSQLQKLNQLLTEAWERNPFYIRYWCEARVPRRPVDSLAEFAAFPFTTRDALVRDQKNAPPLGSNLTHALSYYKRIHRSSGTTHDALFWADTPETWQWVMHCSQQLFVIAGIKPTDRLLFLATFGISSGPWIIYEAACKLGCCCLVAPVGDDAALNKLLNDFQPNVLVGKPSALHRLGKSLASSHRSLPKIEKLILTGEPSLQTTRPCLEQLWSAPCFDRYGMTEAGSIASECPSHSGGLHILGEEFIAECIHPETGVPVDEGEAGELVLTNLGRTARPIIRYRTGDSVRLVKSHVCACGRDDPFLLGGIQRFSHA